MRRKIMAIVLSAAMVFSMSAVGAFAAENDATVLSDATLIGAAPFAGATNVAPGGGNNTPVQPIRVALSEGADTVAGNIDAYIQIKGEDGVAIDVSADNEGDIVVITPDSKLANGATYTVDFDATNLPNILDYSFTTSSGGNNSGGGGGTGQNPQSQALTLTGQIPFDGATVSSGQTLYMLFSNSLIPGTKNNSGIDNLKEHNEGQVSLETADGVEITEGYSVEITDSWTIKITTDGLNAGDYTLVVDTLTANSGKTYAGTEVDFTIAA